MRIPGRAGDAGQPQCRTPGRQGRVEATRAPGPHAPPNQDRPFLPSPRCLYPFVPSHLLSSLPLFPRSPPLVFPLSSVPSRLPLLSLCDSLSQMTSPATDFSVSDLASSHAVEEATAGRTHAPNFAMVMGLAAPAEPTSDARTSGSHGGAQAGSLGITLGGGEGAAGALALEDRASHLSPLTRLLTVLPSGHSQ